MKFLSLSNPWPWSIFDLPEPAAKRIENRSWRPHEGVIGHLVAFHTASSWAPGAFEMWERLGIVDLATARERDYPDGVVCGVVRILGYGSHPTSFEESQRRWYMGDHDGRSADGKTVYGWKLGDVFKLPTPPKMKGGQGLRNLPFHVATDVKRQLADAGRAIV